MARIIAEAIKHNVLLTIHEAKFIDFGWSMNCNINQSRNGHNRNMESVQDGQQTTKSDMADTMLT